jgi:hypothetical protein
MFDVWNEQVGGMLEQFVRTDAFADQAARAADLNRQGTEMTEEFTRRLLRAWNIPSASDIADLKRQVEALDRQVTRLTKTLQEAQDATELKRNA